jgi:hypothetical protein
MDWNRVMNSSHDPLIRKALHHLVPIANPDGIDVIHVVHIRCLYGCHDSADFPQAGIIMRSVVSSTLIVII